MTSSLGENVKRLRGERGWSQARLATESGVNRYTISLVENGSDNNTLSTYQKIADAFGCSLADLFEERVA